MLMHDAFVRDAIFRLGIARMLAILENHKTLVWSETAFLTEFREAFVFRIFGMEYSTTWLFFVTACVIEFHGQ